MSQVFSCSNCGAPIDYDGGPDLTIECPYCKSSVIVPAELRGHTASAAQASALGEIARLARTGKKIEAIKLYRAAFAVGLKEAKQAVERLARGESIGHAGAAKSARARSTSSQTDAPEGGCAWWVWLIVIGLPVAFILLPLIANWSAITEDLLPASATATPTHTPIPSPTRPPSPTPTPPGYASAVLTFGGKGTGAGLFTDARSIALDGAGNVYVADWNGGRVQGFDSTGKFVTQWFVGDSKTIISGMAADRKGTVYVVADGRIFRVEGATGKTLGKLEYPEGDRFNAITLTPDGGLLATWYEARSGLITSIQGHRDDLVRFNAEGKIVQVWRGVISSLTDDPELYNYPAMDGRGNIFIAGGTFDTAIFKFTPEGKFVDRFGSRGNEPGQFSHLQAIAVDNQSRIYVADSRGIQVFDATGRYLGAFKAEGTIYGMVFNDQNELFTVTNSQATKFRLNQP